MGTNGVLQKESPLKEQSDMVIDKSRIVVSCLQESEVAHIVDMYCEDESFNTSTSSNAVPRYKFKINNLRVTMQGILSRVNTYGKLTIDGSLSTFINGNSIEDMDENTVSCLSDTLSDALGIDCTRMELKSLELTYNAFMTSKPSDYYKYFGEYSRKKKVVEDHGLYYKQQRTTSTDSYKMVIYNKVAEMRKKSKVPNEYRDSNILRFEVALKKELSKQLKMELNIGNLRENWKSLAEYLKGEVMKIELKKEMNLDWVNSSADIELLMLMEKIINGTMDSFLEKLKNSSSVNEETLSNYKKKVRKARKLLNEEAIKNNTDDKLEELKQAIANIH